MNTASRKQRKQKMGVSVHSLTDKYGLDKSVIYKYTARAIRPNPINKGKNKVFRALNK
jgi:hypothetical protein